MNQALSKKIGRLQIFCAVLVIIQHSRMSNTVLQDVVCGCLTRVAVPFFFVISGALFYKSFDVSLIWAKRQITNRIRSLLVPYLFWSFFGATIKAITSPEWLAPADFEWWKNVLGVYGIPATAGHLWFVGELMKFTIVGLPIGIAIRYLGLAYPLFCGCCYVAGFKAGHMSSLFWFTIGCWASMNYDRIKGFATNRLAIIAAVMAALTVLLFVCTQNFVGKTMFGGFELCYSLSAMVALWVGFDVAKDALVWRYVDKCVPAAFFMYCFHVFLWRVPMPGFLTRAGFMVGMSLAVFFLWSACMPKFMSVITGMRSERRKDYEK